MSEKEGSPTFVHREPPPAYQPTDPIHPNPAPQPGVAGPSHPTDCETPKEPIPPYPNPTQQPGVALPTENVVLHTSPPSQTVVIQHTGPLPSQPLRVTCPSCHGSYLTAVTHSPSTNTHVIALLLCLICCPCALIPYFTDDCQRADHHCPNCGTYIGSSA